MLSLAAVAVAVFLVLLATAAMARPIPGKKEHVAKGRDLPFCDIVPIAGRPPDIVAPGDPRVKCKGAG